VACRLVRALVLLAAITVWRLYANRPWPDHHPFGTDDPEDEEEPEH
jgi:hypothetical protein